MPPLIQKWNELKDEDKDLFPLLEVKVVFFWGLYSYLKNRCLKEFVTFSSFSACLQWPQHYRAASCPTVNQFTSAVSPWSRRTSLKPWSVENEQP